MHQPLHLLELPEILLLISSSISPQADARTKSSLSQLNFTTQCHLRSTLIDQISVKPSAISSLNGFISRSASSKSLRSCKSLEIKDEGPAAFELKDFTTKNREWSTDLIKLFEKLARINKEEAESHCYRLSNSRTGLKAFTFSTQAEDYNAVASISSLAWKRLAIALSHDLEELSLDLGRDNERIWKALRSSDFKNLTKLKLRLNPPGDWDGNDLQSILNALSGELKELKLCFFSKGSFNLQKLTLENQHPNLESLELDFPPDHYSKIANFVNRHQSTLRTLAMLDDSESIVPLIEQLEQQTLINLKAINLPDFYIFDQLESFLAGLRVLKVGMDLQTSVELLKAGRVFNSIVSCIYISLRQDQTITQILLQIEILTRLFPALTEVGMIFPKPRRPVSYASSAQTAFSFFLNATTAHSDLSQLAHSILYITSAINRGPESASPPAAPAKLKALIFDLNNVTRQHKIKEPETFHRELKEAFRSTQPFDHSQHEELQGLTHLKVRHQDCESQFWVDNSPTSDAASARDSTPHSTCSQFHSFFDRSNLYESTFACTIFNHLC